MGVRLIVEVLDHWQDAGLTAGERDDLIVLAENANDGTRLTWGPVHEPYILKRANKSGASWKNAVSKLLRKKVLTQHVPGRVKQAAVYHLTCLCPEPPHDGYKGFCTRPERVTSQMTHPEGVEKEGHLSDDPQGHLSDDPESREGHLSDDERVTGEVTPTPLVSSFKDPSDTPSSSVAEDSSDVLEGVVIEGGGGGSDQFIKRSDDFVAALDYRGKQPGRTRRDKLTLLVVGAFKAGWNEQTLRDYLDLGGAPVNSAAAVYEHRLHKDELPDAPAPIAGRQAPPPACSSCLEENPGAEFNMRLRQRDGHLCDCHPSVVGMVVQDSSDGGMWGRAMDRAQARMASGGDWSGAGPDERVAGWLALSNSFRDDEREHVPAAWVPKPSTTDKRVHQALEVGRRLQAEHDAKTSPSGHKPYSSDIWERMKQQAADGVRPDGADGQPHCGTCDEYTRTREVEGPSGPHFEPCSRCHPALSF